MKLGGILSSTLIIVLIFITINVLFYMYDFTALLKRKSGHKFRNQTILKYKKAIPQINDIIEEELKLNDSTDNNPFYDDKLALD
jgi:hypothetical protein